MSEAPTSNEAISLPRGSIFMTLTLFSKFFAILYLKNSLLGFVSVVISIST